MILGRVKGICTDGVRAELLQVGDVSSAARDIGKRIDVVSLYEAVVSEVRGSLDAILNLTFPVVVVPLLEIPAW
jgi:hypothetical protein